MPRVMPVKVTRRQVPTAAISAAVATDGANTKVDAGQNYVNTNSGTAPVAPTRLPTHRFVSAMETRQPSNPLATDPANHYTF